MIRHTAELGEEERFGWYRRVGGLGLFLLGVFPDAVPADRGSPAARRLSRADYLKSGRSFYAAAAQHPRADAAVAEVLERLAEAFELAVKPLDHLASPIRIHDESPAERRDLCTPTVGRTDGCAMRAVVAGFSAAC